jgi:hypothetical protein
LSQPGVEQPDELSGVGPRSGDSLAVFLAVMRWQTRRA